MHGGCRGIPLVVASARLSGRSVGQYRWLARFFAETLSGNVVIAAQSAGDAERFRRLGAHPARTHVTGNLKLELEIPPKVIGGQVIRVTLGESRPVWIANSTHKDEEDRACCARGSAYLTTACTAVLAPRKPERFSAVEALLRKRHATTRIRRVA